MNEREIIKRTAEYVKGELSGEGTGHDWWHTERVWKMAKRIGAEERADLFAVELAALLHDIADWKFTGGDDSVGPEKAAEWLGKIGVEQKVIDHVGEIMIGVSFKGAGVQSKMRTKEGMVVQDADRLDALGAFGIARTFAYGGSKGREIYNPGIKSVIHKSFEEYKSTTAPTINHFYEKLLLLKDRMNTKTGKKIADGRHKFMQEYLDQFYKEWDGKDS